MNPEEKQERLKHCARELSEYFDNVQIVASARSKGTTTDSLFYGWGEGDVFARRELCREYILRQKIQLFDHPDIIIDDDDDFDDEDYQKIQ